MSKEMEDLSEKPIFALEEQLARQKGILLNGNLIRKLPDKGAKLKDTVAKLEAELERRKRELASKEAMKNVPDIEKLEWALRTTSLSTASSSALPNGGSPEKMCCNEELDSDDDDEPVKEEEEPKNSDDVLRIIATSQITQREVKYSIDGSASRLKKSPVNSPVMIELKPSPYLAKLVEKDERKGTKEKFLANKSLRAKPPGSSSPATSVSSAEGSSSNSKKGKWDEALLPNKSDFDGVRMMSMEDTINVSCEKYQQVEELKATAPPKKTYAYDKLREQGILGACTVEMQVSRPLPADLDDDEDNFNEEGDLSHDSITEESESDISDNEDEKRKEKSKARDEKTSKDLSGLLNASLKMS